MGVKVEGELWIMGGVRCGLWVSYYYCNSFLFLFLLLPPPPLLFRDERKPQRRTKRNGKKGEDKAMEEGRRGMRRKAPFQKVDEGGAVEA